MPFRAVCVKIVLNALFIPFNFSFSKFKDGMYNIIIVPQIPKLLLKLKFWTKLKWMFKLEQWK